MKLRCSRARNSSDANHFGNESEGGGGGLPTTCLLPRHVCAVACSFLVDTPRLPRDLILFFHAPPPLLPLLLQIFGVLNELQRAAGSAPGRSHWVSIPPPRTSAISSLRGRERYCIPRPRTGTDSRNLAYQSCAAPVAAAAEGVLPSCHNHTLVPVIHSGGTETEPTRPLTALWRRLRQRRREELSFDGGRRRGRRRPAAAGARAFRSLLPNEGNLPNPAAS